MLIALPLQKWIPSRLFRDIGNNSVIACSKYFGFEVNLLVIHFAITVESDYGEKITGIVINGSNYHYRQVLL